MDNYFIIVLVLVTGTLSLPVDSYRADFIPTIPLTGAVRQPPAHMIQQHQQGCVWSTNPNNSGNKNGTGAILPPFLQQRTSANSLSLDCHVRTLNVDFWSNYSFTRDQLESTSRLNVKCNDKLFFESVLEPSQSIFRLRNLHDVSLYSCKIRKIPTRIWSSLGFLKSLTISSLNAEWSSAVGMDIEMGAFEGLTNVEKLDLSQNNIWAIHDKNVFCPLRSLLKLNVSWNRLSDLEELGFGSSSTFRLSNSDEGSSSISVGPCVMNIQNLDLSHNTLRRLHPSAFNRLRKLSELRLQNNLIEELSDSTFQGLSQLRLVNISSNKLVALPPTIFKNNPTLREINLSNNTLTALPPTVFSGLVTLLSLDLSRNALSSQWINGNIFQGLNRLYILRLSHNELNYIDPTLFKDLPLLQSLHLDNNKIESIHPMALSSLTNLRSLDISYNRLSLIDSRHLSNLFLLRQLYLDHNKINEMDNDCLKNTTNLQDLGLADNLLGPEIPIALRNAEHLITLDIGENRIETVSNTSFTGMGQLYGLRIVDNKISEIPNGFCEPMSKLRVLNIAQNRVSKISPSAFSACPELRALRLDTNALEELPTTLAPQLPSLLWLNVSENSLRYADYHLLPQTIEWLDLSYNKLETLGGPVSDGGKDTIPYSLRVLDASHNLLTMVDYSTIPPALETLRLNHNKLKTVADNTFSRASRLRRVELIGNEIENLPLSALRVPQVQSGKQLPEFYIGGNPFVCDCTMEWLTRLNQLSVLRQHPRIVDLDAIVCRPTFSRPGQLVPLVEARPKDFLCNYQKHCFALCGCCDFEFCDCQMTCPDNCTCYHDQSWSSNIVQCSNLNADIPLRIPMDVSELFLDGSSISTLKSHSFIGKKNLRVLYLNNSQIETISNKSFNGLKSLEILRLDSNLLEEIYGYEFADMENLRELYLHNNNIRHISKESFARLSFLQVLRLDGNFLFDYNIWELSNNGYLNSVMLANNPWSCECEFLIPFRAWVAAKTSIVADFSITTCQDEPATVGSNGTNHFNGHDAPLPHPQLIMNMCDHNKELNFNFNPNEDFPTLLESDMLNSNHISAEKVASSSNDMNMLLGAANNDNNNVPHHDNYPPSNDISTAEKANEQKSGEVWTIFTSVLVTLVIVVLVIGYLLFRKDSRTLIPFCLYSWFSLKSISSLFSCCGAGGDNVGKKSSRSGEGMEDADKLFDAYFLYSRKDEDMVLQKMAPELESPSGYASAGNPPQHGGNNYRLCLHYRDLCLSAENPLNADMVLGACDASKRIVLVMSRAFLQNELSHPGFRQAIQTAINKYQNKLVFIHLSGAESWSTITKSALVETSQITSLEWTDKSFWSKLKLILPTPSSPSSLNSTSTISSTGSSAIFNMAPAYNPHHPNSFINYNNALSLHDYAYNTINSQHQYHRNILPYNANNPPVPKHHIALTTPAWQQQQQQQQLQNQNFYNNSQHSQIIPIPGYPVTTISAGATTPLMMQNGFHHQQPNIPSFNESFRRHLQQNQSKVMMNPVPHHHHHLSNCSSSSQGHAHHHHHHQGSHCSTHSSSTNNNPSIHPYQPLDANYSSSSSNEELLDHVYSTLDSPPIMSGSACINNNGCETNSELAKQINDQENNENSSSRISPPLQNRLNNNSTNCPVANNNSSGGQPNSNQPSNGTNNNGTMYFV